jgi:hypothetical protein
VGALGRAFPILLLLSLIAGPSGCIELPPSGLPDPPSEELRSRFGRIGVTWTSSEGPPGGIVPARGPWDGAGRGAVAGMIVDLKFTVAFVGGSAAGGAGAAYAMVGFLALGIGMLPVSAMIGTLYGTLAAPEATAVESAVLTIQAAVVRRHFTQGVAESLLRHASTAIDDSLKPLPSGSSLDDFDTLLEVEPAQLALQGEYGVNPNLRLIVRQSATLRRVADREVLYRITLSHSSPNEAEFLAWARDDAKMFLESLADIDRALGERLADRMFLDYVLPGERRAPQSPQVRP